MSLPKTLKRLNVAIDPHHLRDGAGLPRVICLNEYGGQDIPLAYAIAESFNSFEPSKAKLEAFQEMLDVCTRLLEIAENFSHDRPNSTGYVFHVYETARTVIQNANALSESTAITYAREQAETAGKE